MKNSISTEPVIGIDDYPDRVFRITTLYRSEDANRALASTAGTGLVSMCVHSARVLMSGHLAIPRFV